MTNAKSPNLGAETTINSTDALDMINHGSDVVISIITPVGTKFIGKTHFVGFHSQSYIFLEAPDMTDDKFEYFFQEGFNINVRALSQKGEGATINFKSQIMHVLTEPVAMIMISVPGRMLVHQLRKEARYDVALKGKVYIGSQKVECEIRDVSKGGCRFITGALMKNYDVGDQVSIEIITSVKTRVKLQSLEGQVCNLQSSQHYAKYGLKFDETGRASVRLLLACLQFNGTQLALKGC